MDLEAPRWRTPSALQRCTQQRLAAVPLLFRSFSPFPVFHAAQHLLSVHSSAVASTRIPLLQSTALWPPADEPTGSRCRIRGSSSDRFWSHLDECAPRAHDAGGTVVVMASLGHRDPFFEPRLLVLHFCLQEWRLIPRQKEASGFQKCRS